MPLSKLAGRASRSSVSSFLPYAPEGGLEGVSCDFTFSGFSEVRAVMLTGVQRSGGITWLVAPGLAMIAVTYGLARFA